MIQSGRQGAKVYPQANGTSRHQKAARLWSSAEKPLTDLAILEGISPVGLNR